MPDSVWKRISMTRAISFVALVASIVVIGILFYRVMANFLLPLFLAALLVVIFRPLHLWFLVRCGGRARVAAGLTTATILLIVLAPIGLVTFLAVNEGVALAADLDVRTIQQRLSKMRTTLGLDSRHAEALRKIDLELNDLDGDAVLPPNVLKARVGKLLERVEELEAQLVGGPDVDEAEIPAAERTEEFVDRARETIAPLRQSLQDLASAAPGSLESDRALHDAHAALRRVKQHVLGGQTQAWMKQVANPTEDELRELRNSVFHQFQGGILSAGAATGLATVKLLIGLVIMILSLYFFLADGPAMLAGLMRLSPLNDQYERELLDEFIKISRAVVVATLLSALVQGLLAGIGFWFADVHAVFLLMSVTAVFALIPFVGAWSVWVPVCLYLLFYEERAMAAIVLAVYCGVVVSTSDNVVKAAVLHGQSRLHPLLALLSVLGGVAALGPIGILVGPMVVVFLQNLLNIMQRELASLDERIATTMEGHAAAVSVTREAPAAAAPIANTNAVSRQTAKPASSTPPGKRSRRRNKK